MKYRSKVALRISFALVLHGFFAQTRGHSKTRSTSIVRSLPSFAFVELFTSQGCHSCPPADAWIGKLENEQIVPIAWHVDYWNYLGWKDSFSKAAYSNRQRQYGRIWKSKNVFTPAVVANGDLFPTWRKDKLPRLRKESVQMILHHGKSNHYVEILPSLERNVTFHHVVTQSQRVNIRAGENAGKSIQYEYPVMTDKSKNFKLDKIRSKKFRVALGAGRNVMWLEDKATFKTLSLLVHTSGKTAAR